MSNGFVLLCDKNLFIQKFLFDNLSRSVSAQQSIYFNEFCDPNEQDKVNLFFDFINENGAALNWEINVAVNEGLKTFQFYGVKLDDDYIIIGLDKDDNIYRLYDELLKLNNENANYIRTVVKEKILQQNSSSIDLSAFEGLSKLNNELADLHRVLAKKNVELKKLVELKNQFLGIASHDLRNPLSAISSYTEFLLTETKNNITEEQYSFLQYIKSSSEFMLSLVNDLLNYTKLESGELDLNLEITDLIEFIKENIERNKILAKKKNITLTFSSELTSLLRDLDKTRFEQVINNLIGNAVKFSYPSSTINVYLYSDFKQTRIVVEDFGKGIEEKQLTSIFLPFNKSTSKGTEGEASTGLGLAITKKIVESHTGTITVESTLGKGSKFTISLFNVSE